MTETGAPPPEEAAPQGEVRLIRSLRLTNFLSFGPQGEEVELRGLNVLVGANGSGKSNLVEALGLLAAAGTGVTEPIRRGGGIDAWIYNGSPERHFRLDASISLLGSMSRLAYSLKVSNEHRSAFVESESIMGSDDSLAPDLVVPIYRSEDGRGYFPNGGYLSLPDRRSSILQYYREYPNISEYGALRSLFAGIRLYRSWPFGPGSVVRAPQDGDQPDEVLSDGLENLFLILQRLDLNTDPEARELFLERLRDVLPDAANFTVQSSGSKLQLYVRQGRHLVPASRLSDGTLRWLCLLAVLIAPAPPCVVVLEEPELGLHPDLINTLSDLLKKAAQRMQLVVTTHSDILIDALSDVPESVMVVEKEENGTTVHRLNVGELQPWLEEYRLGRLWMQGQIGGTRW